MRWPIRQAPVIFCAALALTGCQKEATGQVAAVVNGDEITLQEVNAELATANVPEDVDKKAIQQSALQRIVERRLFAQIAQEDELDKSQEYIMRERQLKDGLLTQMLMQKIERAMQVPDQAEIDGYIEDNPGLFGERTIYSIDRIQFPMPENFARLNALQDDHSMEAAATTLDRLNIKYTRQPAQMDALMLGPERLKLIQALPEGEPFVIPENGTVTVAVITGTRKQPITTEEARPLAVRVLRNQKLREAMQQRLQTAKGKAEIEYQSGFAPTAPNDKAREPAATAAKR